MGRHLIARKEAPVMTKGTLLDLKVQKRKGLVPVTVTFKEVGSKSIPGDSVVISVGMFATYEGKTYLRCISPIGLCWIRIGQLLKRRPGGEPETGTVVEKPKRLSAK